MQQTVTLLYTRRRRNPVSWLIRWAMPRSRFSFALSSHVIVLARGRYYESTMLAGVHEVDEDIALKGQTIVRHRDHLVPDLDAGIAWARSQLCTYQPRPPRWMPQCVQRTFAFIQMLRHNNYDWRGALGLSLAPGRDWAEEDVFFCYEFAAAFLRACGRDEFAELSHIGETALLAINV